MKHLVLVMIVGVLMGCGKKKAPENKADPSVIRDTLREMSYAEFVIRAELNKPQGELTKSDYDKVTKLTIMNPAMTEMSGLEKLSQLKALDLTGNHLTSVSGIDKLTNLEILDLAVNKLSIPPLEKSCKT